MSKQEVEEFYPETKQHLRKWLQKNHLTKDAVWLVFYKKHGLPLLKQRRQDKTEF